MKILLLSWKDLHHPQKGGAEVVMYNYAKRLVKKGHDVTWIGSAFPNGKAKETYDGIQVYRIGSINTIYFVFPKFYKQHLQGKYDIVVDEAGGLPLFSPFFIKDIPIVFFIHHISDIEWDFKYPFPVNKIGKHIYKRIIKLYKHYPTVTVSHSTKQELIECYGFKDQNTSSIENALDIEVNHTLDIYDKKKEILFFGRLMPMKRVEHAILAFHHFWKNSPDYILNIIGPCQDTQYFTQLSNFVKELGLEENVTFHGGISLQEREILAKNTCMLVPSYKEGYGLVVLEGNVYGIPCIGYDVPGIRDSIVEGVNGYKVKNGDYQAMGEKIQEIVSDNTSYTKLISNSYEHVKQHRSWDTNTDRFEELLFGELQ